MIFLTVDRTGNKITCLNDRQFAKFQHCNIQLIVNIVYRHKAVLGVTYLHNLPQNNLFFAAFYVKYLMASDLFISGFSFPKHHKTFTGDKREVKC